MKQVRKKKLRKIFNRNWPFTVNSIELYCMAGTAVYCQIHGINYGLNGKSIDILKLPEVPKSYRKEDIKLSTPNQKAYLSLYPIIKKGLNMFTDREVAFMANMHKQIKMIKSK